jgi:hypothetical protein
MKLFAFVLMPFAKKFDKRYEAIKRAIDRAGMTGTRVDEQTFYRQGITQKVLKQIEEAGVIIADMSTNNPNVLYEVGYSHAKNKLTILLTKDTSRIPFDLKDRPHVGFSNLKDLENKLSHKLEELAVEVDLAFSNAEAECVAQVSVAQFSHHITGRSDATSIRVKVTTGSEVGAQNVFAQIIGLKRRSGKTRRWTPFTPMQPIQLTWTDTDGPATDLPPAIPRYVNVFHIDHNDNNISIWKACQRL